ncbi:hypothetical protein CDL15_Pgr029214 [Punica granatum]|uniref:Uncharacterized protein n=1 Tax=Punica granatum TaxID=22663 RepID=A0A218XD35_PUNGR|nr:hypothetical protein CDL15_Pgr029214 [Punica granatum]
MHVRGARCTGRAAGVHRRRAAGVRGRAAGCTGGARALCWTRGRRAGARLDAREARGRAGRAAGLSGRAGLAAVRACARLDARACGYGCTVHPRARSSPEMRKST